METVYHLSHNLLFANLVYRFAVAALQAGVPINFVRKWLGHARLTTTEIYADAVGEEEQAIARKFWETF